MEASFWSLDSHRQLGKTGSLAKNGVVPRTGARPRALHEVVESGTSPATPVAVQRTSNISEAPAPYLLVSCLACSRKRAGAPGVLLTPLPEGMGLVPAWTVRVL